MRRLFLAAIAALFVVGNMSAFTISDGEGNKVKISTKGVKVKASSGEEIVISPVGVKVTDDNSTTVNINGEEVNASTDGERNTKTGIVLASQNKIVVEARRSAMNFNEINASKAIRVTVEERTAGNIIVRAPQSIMPYVSLTVKDNTLYATILSGAPVSRNSNILADVYVPYNGQINEITTHSAARVIVKPTISCKELDLEATSASVIEVTASAKEVSIDALGASHIKAELATDELDAEFSGASSITLSGQVTNADIEVSGASTLRADKLRAANIELDCSGASKAYALGVNCSVEASGASAVIVECLSQLNASASGASQIIYSGDCKPNIIRNSGASSIRKK